MYFDILDSKGEEIRDPDSGESLGSIDRSKTRVRNHEGSGEAVCCVYIQDKASKRGWGRPRCIWLFKNTNAT